MKTILAFGETLWDLLPSGPVLGGAPCNFAYRVNSLGDRGILVTRLGRDELGQRAFQRLQELGMDTSFVQWDDEHPTGTVPVTIDANGVPDFTITPDVAFDHIELGDEILEQVLRADCIYFGSLIQRSGDSLRTLLALLNHNLLLRKPQAPVFVDLNFRKGCYTKASMHDSIPWADLIKLNHVEAAELSVVPATTPLEQARCLYEQLAIPVVVTLGDQGAVAADRRKEGKIETIQVPGWKVPVVDTVGSGDAFSAAFLHCWLRERSLEDCCFFGNALGAMVASTAGATAPVSVDEINRFCGRSI